MSISRILVLGLVPAILAACDVGDRTGEEALEMDTTAERAGEATAGERAPGIAMAAYDADGDGRLERGEFTAWTVERDWFRGWDRDAGGTLDEDEFAEGAFDRWDADADGRLTEDEWDRGAEGWLEEADRGTWADWDTDADGALTRDEFRAGWDGSGGFSAWDRDRGATLDEDEFGEGWFGLFDADADSAISEEEWEAGSRDWAR